MVVSMMVVVMCVIVSVVIVSVVLLLFCAACKDEKRSQD